MARRLGLDLANVAWHNELKKVLHCEVKALILLNCQAGRIHNVSTPSKIKPYVIRYAGQSLDEFYGITAKTYVDQVKFHGGARDHY